MLVDSTGTISGGFTPPFQRTLWTGAPADGPELTDVALVRDLPAVVVERHDDRAAGARREAGQDDGPVTADELPAERLVRRARRPLPLVRQLERRGCGSPGREQAREGEPAAHRRRRRGGRGRPIAWQQA